MQLGKLEIAILAWLAGYDRATASEIGDACEIEATSTRGRLIVLQMHKLVTGERTNLPSRAKTYAITEEGRRRLET